MIRIDIRPVWRFRGDTERELDFVLVNLLAEVAATRKLTCAAEAAGVSYRHAWNLIAEWEAFFGAPLVVKERGRGTRLTPLGERLLWSARRAQARLAPELENLAAEVSREINESLRGATALAIQASHDYAIGLLRDLAAGAGFEMDLQYKGSFDALAALRRGECDIAGFHVPDGRLGELMARRYSECLPPGEHRLVRFVTRQQGLMVRAGNPKGIAAVADLCRQDVRMVNRQRGSGTRALLEFMLSSEGIERTRLRGYDNEEMTHGAVAALIAGHQADAGLGIHAAAAQYGLDFVPLCAESYFLACRTADLDSGRMRSLLALLRGERFARLAGALPGYSAAGAGDLLAIHPTASFGDALAP